MCDDAERLATIPLPRVRAMIAEAVAKEREAILAKLSQAVEAACREELAGLQVAIDRVGARRGLPP